VIKRVVAVLALVLVVLGCAGDPEPSLELGEPVQLLPGYPNVSVRGCYAMSVTGPFVVDPEYGTAMIIEDLGAEPFRAIIGWPPGYTGRRVGSEVAVLDRDGTVVALTGRKYRVERAGLPPADDSPIGFWICHDPEPLP
jgi:hypothetical protein